MDGSVGAASESEYSARRRSGRVLRAPTKFAPDASASAASKRKRSQGDADADDFDDESDEEMSDDDDDAASYDDQPASKSRRPPPSGRIRKPSTKKVKTNGAQSSRSDHASRIANRPKKAVRIDTGHKGPGLYADIFGSGESSDAVAQKWLEKYREDGATAMSNLVNCILQCAGCDLEVTTDDIRDPENIPNRLIDLQSIHQEQHISDYPLISKTKVAKSFRDLLLGFFRSLVILLHETDVLYKVPDLMDNLHAWLASMSSSSLRPFRHTATTISLCIQSGLVEIAGVLDRRTATIEQQSLAAKRSRNKSKAAEIQRSLDEANASRRLCSDAIQSFFDAVFVHRYRDVDPKIRTECVEALGSWIWQLPTVFMEPGYLRYLGWMLSDTNAATRQEVLRQLSRVFKRDAQQLGHFIDRFRPRMIEMATLDAEVSVRVAAISAIDILRAAALLEPDEIDAIGKLIFDTELRVRKAVVNFFVACIQDVHESKLEEIGGADVLDELDDAAEDDFESPRKEWINIKSLAETLAIYDSQIEQAGSNGLAPGVAAADLLEANVPDSRISLAAQALYDKLPEIKAWEMLAGYLLFDHTTNTKSRSRSNSQSGSAEAAFRKLVAPNTEEEFILLDVLSSAIKSSLAHASEHDKGRKRGHRSDAAEAHDDIALELTNVIPRLLNKFGAEPGTAAIVLRLEHFLNLDVFQQLRQDSIRYKKLLDEVSTQFNRHDDKRVLSEATSALLHARQHEELEELTENKLSQLWETTINGLRNFDETCQLSVRGNLVADALGALSTILMKMSKLASISDCVDVLEAGAKSRKSREPAIQILIKVVHRGKYEPQEVEIDDLEDEVVSFAIKACQFYFMWKTRALSKLLSAGTGLPDAELNQLAELRQSYRRHLIETFSSRAAIDQLRLFSTGGLCDLHLTFATLRPFIKNFRPSGSASKTMRIEKVKALTQEIEPGLVPELISIFDGAEKQFAKKAKKDKTLNEPAEDEDPLADDEELDEDEDEDLPKEERYAAELKAEKALCELTAKYVLVLVANLIDDRGSQASKLRRRILRNQAKLGNNFKEVVAYLDEERLSRRSGPKKPAGPKAAHPHAAGRRTARDDDDDDEDNDEDDEDDNNINFDIFDHGEPEEGSHEDLRRRELLDDDPLDDLADHVERLASDVDDDMDILGD